MHQNQFEQVTLKGLNPFFFSFKKEKKRIESRHYPKNARIGQAWLSMAIAMGRS